jgi:hypothetical protein
VNISSIEAATSVLLDASLPLFDRYRALFALRDRGGEHAPFGVVRRREERE